MWFGVAFARERSLINTQPYHSYTVNNQAKQKMSKEFWKRKDWTFTRFLYPSFFLVLSVTFYSFLHCFFTFYFLSSEFFFFSIYLPFFFSLSLSKSLDCFTFIRFSFHPVSFYDSHSRSLYFQHFSFSTFFFVVLSLFFGLFWELCSPLIASFSISIFLFPRKSSIFIFYLTLNLSSSLYYYLLISYESSLFVFFIIIFSTLSDFPFSHIGHFYYYCSLISVHLSKVPSPLFTLYTIYFGWTNELKIVINF